MTLRIVTFCNAGYIPVAQNWLRALEQIGMDKSATIVSLDDATRSAFASKRILHRPLCSEPNGLAALWSHRIKILRDLISTGETVIHSDADAIWLRNPMADIEACNAPIVFSQGTYWPPDVHERHGLVLCCGFFCLRPDPQVLRFLDAVTHRMRADGDDQIAVNRVVDVWIKEWHINEPYEIPFRNTRFIASRSPIRANGRDEQGNTVTIAVLPHHRYPRLLDAVSEETVVAHPLSGKSLKEKQICLGKLGLWVTQNSSTRQP